MTAVLASRDILKWLIRNDPPAECGIAGRAAPTRGSGLPYGICIAGQPILGQGVASRGWAACGIGIAGRPGPAQLGE